VKNQGGPEGGPRVLREVSSLPAEVGFTFQPLLRACPQPSGCTTFASFHPAQTRRNFPSFSLETWSLALSAVKIGEISGTFWRGLVSQLGLIRTPSNETHEASVQRTVMQGQN